MAKAKKIYQFKITLEGTSPAIWRRIQVPEYYSFWDLHVAIQNSMGWLDSHLHVFRHPDNGSGIGIPDEDGFIDAAEINPGWKVKLSRYFEYPDDFMEYEYDFGDSWKHMVKLEKILPAVPGRKYPRCIAGRMACPPEDCGGLEGYNELVDILADPFHEEYESTVKWLDELYNNPARGIYSPDIFNPAAVKFDDPSERLKTIFSEPDIDLIEDSIRKKHPSLRINDMTGK